MPIFSKNAEIKKNSKKKIEEVVVDDSSLDALTEEKIESLEKKASSGAIALPGIAENKQQESSDQGLAEDEHEIL